MNLLYPKNRESWNPNQLPEIPSRFGGSGYYLIASAYSGLDLYVCFTDELRTSVWIEKTSKLNPKANHLIHEMLVRIDSDEEFDRAYKFFIEKGFLDDLKSKQS